MWIDDMKEVGFPTKHTDNSLVVSLLGSKVVARTEGAPLEYVNEIGVQVYCELLIQDALSVLGLTDKWVKVRRTRTVSLLLACELPNFVVTCNIPLLGLATTTDAS